ncbi:MAG: hypothetical protein KGJ55_09625 [Gammaproteobacteria bacterium]|nr:hypothetical protein [Gammaproteobacteria bacterium]
METAVLVAQLEAAELDAGQFDHRAHVRAAWHYLNVLPLPEAAHRFAAVLQAYVRRLSAQEKFHLTLTLAFMHLIHQRMHAGESWDRFSARYPELFRDAGKLINRHYSPQALERGRREFAEPDLAALP